MLRILAAPLAFIRNTCAYNRLWNRDFTITAELPRKPAHLAGEFVSGSRKLYNTLVMLLHFMDIIAPAITGGKGSSS